MNLTGSRPEPFADRSTRAVQKAVRTMERMHTAHYLLLASAFVLAAMLVTRIQDHGVSFLPEARAAMVEKDGGLVMMTARTQDDEESLFVIDSSSQALLIYRTRVGTTPRLELAQRVSLARLFRLPSGPAAGAARAPQRPGRVER